TLTGILFQIGVFPVVMMVGTLIFFSEQWHLRWMRWIWKGLDEYPTQALVSQSFTRFSQMIFLAFFGFQLLFPWRYLLYPGNLFWTEEGFRFSWRVMLVEKAGTAHFYIQDGPNGAKGLVDNRNFLNAHQEKQMSYQPDMILQYAHFLKQHYQNQGIQNPVVTAEVYVTLNGRPSKPLFDADLNLAEITDSWAPKKWLNPYPW
ncbi:MAG: HTTM domain-containing protein, partial [Bacteroidota bacterium]|nr:HTTM domain-containing protein [Bacteroidota bacterium]MDX5431840.1 HTTM domain-containing protein [Bacteroidota bacterium]MDX5470551.1 HTTM domain-containing protein [Bacteroidota bacterium]